MYCAACMQDDHDVCKSNCSCCHPNLTEEQIHELMGIESNAEIVEFPSEWNDTTGVIPEGSVVLTYRVGSYHYAEVIIEPNGTRHQVR
jgi:hypothetical protein